MNVHTADKHMLQTANINRNSQVTGRGVPVILSLKYKSASVTEGYLVTSDCLRWLKGRFTCISDGTARF